jgi:CO/xanthine dehydrogenase FAD-binding subunit
MDPHGVPRAGGFASTRSARKIPQPGVALSIVGAAAVVTVDGNGVCQKASVGLNGITGKPVAAVGVEQALAGKRLTEQTMQEAAAKAAAGQEPLGDIFASAAYRAHLAGLFTASPGVFNTCV